MTSRQPNEKPGNGTTHERPSSFREILYRDRRLLSRRQMDKRIRERADARADARAEARSGEQEYVTYFPALSRMFGGGAAAEWRAVLLIIALVLGAFFFGRWVGQHDAPPPQSAPAVTLEI